MQAVVDVLATLQAGVDSDLAAANQAVAGIQAKKDLIAQLGVSIEDEKKAYGDQQWDEATKAAMAAAGSPDGKVYSVEEDNANIQAALAPVQKKLDDALAQNEMLSAKIAELQAIPPAPVVDVEAEKVKAVEAFKATALAQLKAEEADMEKIFAPAVEAAPVADQAPQA